MRHDWCCALTLVSCVRAAALPSERREAVVVGAAGDLPGPPPPRRRGDGGVGARRRWAFARRQPPTAGPPPASLLEFGPIGGALDDAKGSLAGKDSSASAAGDVTPMPRLFVEAGLATGVETDQRTVTFVPRPLAEGAELCDGVVLRNIPTDIEKGMLWRGPSAIPKDVSISITALRPVRIYVMDREDKPEAGREERDRLLFPKQYSCGFPVALGAGWTEEQRAPQMAEAPTAPPPYLPPVWTTTTISPNETNSTEDVVKLAEEVPPPAETSSNYFDLKMWQTSLRADEVRSWTVAKPRHQRCIMGIVVLDLDPPTPTPTPRPAILISSQKSDTCLCDAFGGTFAALLLLVWRTH